MSLVDKLYACHEVYMIVRGDLCYKHDYPCGRLVIARKAQIYATKGAAVRQARQLGNCSVVKCDLTVYDDVEVCREP